MMETPILENITVSPFYDNGGNHTQWELTPNEGHVLHDRLLDIFEQFDEETGEGLGEPIRLNYYSGTRTVGVDYDFAANPREFYAVLRSKVDEKKDERG